MNDSYIQNVYHCYFSVYFLYWIIYWHIFIKTHYLSGTSGSINTTAGVFNKYIVTLHRIVSSPSYCCVVHPDPRPPKSESLVTDKTFRNYHLLFSFFLDTTRQHTTNLYLTNNFWNITTQLREVFNWFTKQMTHFLHWHQLSKQQLKSYTN